MSEAAGAAPLAFSTTVRPSGSWISAKRSPPTPHMCGYTTARVVAAASAASTALPPLSKASSPAAVASTCGVAMANRRPVPESARSVGPPSLACINAR